MRVILSLCVLVYLGSILSCPTPASAHLIDPFNTIPKRPLILPLGVTQTYSGTSSDVSSSGPFSYWEIPFGGGRAFSKRYEGGLDSALKVVPLDTADPLARLRLYGRALLIRKVLALQVGVWFPVMPRRITRGELMLPLRLKTDRMYIFGESKFSYDSNHMWTFSNATALLVRISSAAYFGLDLGADVAKQRKIRLPVGLAVGIPLAFGVFLKGSLRFHDLFKTETTLHNPRWGHTGYGQLASPTAETKWRGLDSRVVDLTVVTPF